jgi:hypothetical protein
MVISGYITVLSAVIGIYAASRRRYLAHNKFLLKLFNRLECYPKIWIPLLVPSEMTKIRPFWITGGISKEMKGPKFES